jgi:exopolysaccharide biosynthesis protein
VPVPEWESWGQGIEYAFLRVVADDGPVALHLVRFDPAEVPLSVESRRNRQGAALLTDPKRFLRESRAVVAVNASPYATETLHAGGAARISGLSLESGRVVYPPSDRLWAFYVTGGARGNKGDFGLLPPGAPLPEEAYQGAGGFEPLVVDGRPRGYSGQREARTAIGETEEGRLYIAVVDGPRWGHSRGATTAELGRWLTRLGLVNALNLDGGGSSVLLRRGRTVNRPVAGLLHGRRRPVANVLLIGQGDLE